MSENNYCTGLLNIFPPQNDITVKGLSPGVHKTVSLYSWKFLPLSARSHWLLRGHMTSNNETRISMLPLVWETLRFSGNKIIYFARDQSLSVYCCVAFPHRPWILLILFTRSWH